MRKIFPCHSWGDLSSLFRGRELARPREEGIWGASQGRIERQATDGELLEELAAALRAADGPSGFIIARLVATGWVLGFAIYSIIFLASQTICEKRNIFWRKASINIRTAASCYQHNRQSIAATSIAIKINPQVMDVHLSRREAASPLSGSTPDSKTKRRLSG
jgi:hypothetical protein